MERLVKQREELDKLRELLGKLDFFKTMLPPGVFIEDIETFLSELKYLCGYIDCMIKFKNELVES